MTVRREGFRADINGLRAIAVAAVLLFHFSVPGFGGGYAGVDVFYVISGFLMTQIILGRMEGERFSLAAFYWARAQRIVPALAGLCATLVVLGAFFVDPAAYSRLASQAAWSLTFLSNFLFAGDAGYFSPAAEESWFLHTWSLSVEWQFYIAYPLVLMALRRSALLWRNLGPILIGLAALSLALSIALSPADVEPRLAFYMLPTRAWEMLAGGLVAIYASGTPARRTSGLCLVAGLLLIVSSVAFAHSTLPWPSYWAVGPVAGAVLVIAAARPDARWTRIPGLQALGLWSYSIYLWHWPVAVAQRYFELPDGLAMRGVLMAASVALGWLSYRHLEVGLRKLAFSGSAARVSRTAAPFIVLTLAVAGLAALTDGFYKLRERGLEPTERAAVADYRAAWGDWRFSDACPGAGDQPCRIGNPEARDVLVIGNSHAQQFAIRYFDLLPKDGSQGVTFEVAAGCPPLPGVGRSEAGFTNCRTFLKRAFGRASAEGFQRVVLLSSWDGFFKGEAEVSSRLCFERESKCVTLATNKAREAMTRQAFGRLASEITRLNEQGIEVVVMLPFPSSSDNDPRRLYKAMFLGWDRPQTVPVKAALERSGFARRLIMDGLEASGAYLADPTRELCKRGCPVYENGTILYKDKGHYRASVVRGATFDFLDRYLLDPRPLGAKPADRPHVAHIRVKSRP